jgi:hypothetical protein
MWCSNDDSERQGGPTIFATTFYQKEVMEGVAWEDTVNNHYTWSMARNPEDADSPLKPKINVPTSTLTLSCTLITIVIYTFQMLQDAFVLALALFATSKGNYSEFWEHIGNYCSKPKIASRLLVVLLPFLNFF